MAPANVRGEAARHVPAVRGEAAGQENVVRGEAAGHRNVVRGEAAGHGNVVRAVAAGARCEGRGDRAVREVGGPFLWMHHKYLKTPQ
ncbi:hypothetical protein GDO81_004633 [Engystomops pustulosus]|uniref:Uncharacterized protein n=1 Tax=Engystomops pustulosus TaxID=76066 RepID=A0AAV6ZTR7_ENGPU|nr:hypothetical protein GDO81_004633 [Engystomops pustulosus]